jgi:nitroreductase
MSNESTEIVAAVSAVIHGRQTILPKHLHAPGPDAQQLTQMLRAACSAPDHGQVRPWRLIEVPASERASLGECFAQALRDRDPQALPAQVEQARDKAFRAPVLMLLVVDAACGDPEIDLHERVVAAGCCAQNMLLMATALGFGSALTSGKALKADVLRQRFGLLSSEHALCFINVGSVLARKPVAPRPEPGDVYSVLASVSKNSQ